MRRLCGCKAGDHVKRAVLLRSEDSMKISIQRDTLGSVLREEKKRAGIKLVVRSLRPVVASEREAIQSNNRA